MFSLAFNKSKWKYLLRQLTGLSTIQRSEDLMTEQTLTWVQGERQTAFSKTAACQGSAEWDLGKSNDI